MDVHRVSEGELVDVRVALLGGIPAVIGGGGLEVQLWETERALRAAGCEVSRGELVDVDVLHVFGAEPSSWHWLQHWIRNPVPLVVSPILASSSGRALARQYLVSHLAARLKTPSRMRGEVLDRAASVIALTDYESSTLQKVYNVPQAKLVKVSNGTDAAQTATRVPSEGWVIQVGAITGHKRQLEVAAALGGLGVPCRLFGAAAPSLLPALDGLVRSQPLLTWFGHQSHDDTVRATARAAALILFSVGEGQSLAVVDALALGVPAVLSDIPVHRELAETYRNHVRLIRGLDELGPALEWAKSARELPPPTVPTWADVALQLLSVYRGLLNDPR